MKRMFTLSLAVVVATIAVYWGIAALTGGPSSLLHKAFGGAVSALTIVGLIVALSMFGWYLYWLSARDHGGPAVHALIGVAALVVAAIVGIRWVQWSFGLLWLIPLFAPAVLAAWLLSVIAKRLFGAASAPRATTTRTSAANRPKFTIIDDTTGEEVE